MKKENRQRIGGVKRVKGRSGFNFRTTTCATLATFYNNDRSYFSPQYAPKFNVIMSATAVVPPSFDKLRFNLRLKDNSSGRNSKLSTKF